MWRAYWDQALSVAPGLADVLPIIEFIKSSWHTIESVLLLAGFVWINHRLKRERLKMSEVVERLGERVETFGQFAKAALDAAEEVPASPEVSRGGVASYELLKGEWLDIRDRIELLIQKIEHKQVRAKYVNMDRRNYWNIIVGLREDGFIRPQIAMLLLNMYQSFIGLRSRPSKVTAGDVQQFQTWVKSINGSLPKLQKPKPPLPPQRAVPIAAE